MTHVTTISVRFAIPALVLVAITGTSAHADPTRGSQVLEQHKGFFLQTDDGRHRMRILGRLNLQASGTSTTSAADDRTQAGAMQIRRARLMFEGKLYDDLLAFRFQTESGAGQLQLRDFLFDVTLPSNLYLRAGQWKRPFSRQQIAGYDKLELIDRAITDRAFFAGRDVGVALHNGYEKSPGLEWIVGVFNGTDVTPAIRGSADDDGAVTGSLSNVPAAWKPALIGRVGLNHGGIKGYTEADLEGGPLRAAAAASAMIEADWDRDSAASHRAQLDGIVKYEGFDASAGLYASTQGTGLADDQGAALAGMHVQGGYVMCGRYQPVARYAATTALGDNTAPSVHDVAIGFNAFFIGHAAKLMTSASARKTGDRAFTDELRVDLGTYFEF